MDVRRVDLPSAGWAFAATGWGEKNRARFALDQPVLSNSITQLLCLVARDLTKLSVSRRDDVEPYAG